MPAGGRSAVVVVVLAVGGWWPAAVVVAAEVVVVVIGNVVAGNVVVVVIVPAGVTGGASIGGMVAVSGASAGTLRAFGYDPTTAIFRSREAKAFATRAQRSAAMTSVAASRRCLRRFMFVS